MQGLATLVTAIAALMGAIAWPIIFIALLVIFRDPLRAASGNLPQLVGRMQKLKLGAFEAELSAETAPLVDEAIARPGDISPRQIRSAARISVAAHDIGGVELRRQLRRLCLEYQTLRKTLPPGERRTRAMVEVLVRLRTLAPSVVGFLGELKASAASGERLAAVAIMQVDPDLADLKWIVDRFRSDDPFVFFQAATVLWTLVNRDAGSDPAVLAAAREALSIMRAFPGVPDTSTLELLETISAGSLVGRGD